MHPNEPSHMADAGGALNPSDGDEMESYRWISRALFDVLSVLLALKSGSVLSWVEQNSLETACIMLQFYEMCERNEALDNPTMEEIIKNDEKNITKRLWIRSRSRQMRLRRRCVRSMNQSGRQSGYRQSRKRAGSLISHVVPGCLPKRWPPTRDSSSALTSHGR